MDVVFTPRSNLMGLVKEQTEVGEDHPKLLPAIAILEFSQQISGQLVLYGNKKTQNISLKRCLYKLFLLSVWLLNHQSYYMRCDKSVALQPFRSASTQSSP